MTEPVVVAGAGIGGLTTALLLARAGRAVTVIERRTRLETEGAGIQLSPNASRILIEAGLGPAIARRAVAPPHIDIRSGRSGAMLARIPLGGAVEGRYGAPYLVIHRADLQDVLFDALRGQDNVRIQFGRTVDGFEDDGTRIEVRASRENGGADICAGSALIGADGLWSRVGDLVDTPSPPRFTGSVAWRAVVAADAVEPALRTATGLWLGPDAHLVHYPIRAGREVNIVAIVRDDDAMTGWSRPGEADRLMRRFGNWHETPRTILSAARSWLIWSLFGRSPRRRWSTGRACVMGDAAHPMVPFLAQGGAMAIEDARVITRLITNCDADAVPQALQRYEAVRKPRATRVQQEAAQNGRVYHFGGPLAFARDLVLKSRSGTALLDRYDWLYRWRDGD
jgi:salicylate hydroxylase